MDLRSLRYFVAVAEELNFRRAATRLVMTQPPLSRAVRALEDELGTELVTRSSSGVTLTDAGSTLLREARELLARADRLPATIARAAGARTLTIGTLADSVEQVGLGLIDAFRERYPDVEIRVVEANLTDPTVGVGSGAVDVALTRGPFETSRVAVRVLREDRMSVILTADDPLAGRSSVSLADLDDREWFRFPPNADPVWRAFWAGGAEHEATRRGPVVHTVRECLESVLWSGSIGLAPTLHELPGTLVGVPVTGLPPSPLVVAWRAGDTRPLVRGFVELAAALAGRGETAL